MRAIIICGGNVSEYIKDYIKKDDFIICADSGYDRAEKFGIEPDVIIGDMDSIAKTPTLENRIVYPMRKDFTDSELVVQYALEHGYDEILMFGMIGTRMDHSLANVALLKQTKGKKAVIIDANNEIYFAEEEFILLGKAGDTVSIIPFEGDAVGVTTEGLDYPLDCGIIKSGTTLGISNVMTGEVCKITIKSGSAFIIRSKD